MASNGLDVAVVPLSQWTVDHVACFCLLTGLAPLIPSLRLARIDGQKLLSLRANGLVLLGGAASIDSDRVQGGTTNDRRPWVLADELVRRIDLLQCGNREAAFFRLGPNDKWTDCAKLSADASKNNNTNTNTSKAAGTAGTVDAGGIVANADANKDQNKNAFLANVNLSESVGSLDEEELDRLLELELDASKNNNKIDEDFTSDSCSVSSENCNNDDHWTTPGRVGSGATNNSDSDFNSNNAAPNTTTTTTITNDNNNDNNTNNYEETFSVAGARVTVRWTQPPVKRSTNGNGAEILLAAALEAAATVETSFTRFDSAEEKSAKKPRVRCVVDCGARGPIKVSLRTGSGGVSLRKLHRRLLRKLGEVPGEAVVLRTHDGAMVRSSRDLQAAIEKSQLGTNKRVRLVLAGQWGEGAKD